MEKSDRRRFLKQASMLVGAGICASCASSFLTACEQDILIPPVPVYKGTQRIPLASGNLASGCGGKFDYTFSYTLDGKNYSKRIMIFNQGNGKYQAFDAVCPHIQSELTWDCNSLICNQHLSTFSPVDGHVTLDKIGGTLKPLPYYTTTVEGSEIVVKFGDK